MDRCPTCDARYRGGQFCHRCQTDLRQILAVEEAAKYHRQQAQVALRHGLIRKARRCALSACELHHSPASIETLALAALVDRDFAAALALWKTCRSTNRSEE